MSSLIANPAAVAGELSPEIHGCIRRALAEDIGTGDVTTESIVPAKGKTSAQIVAKQPGIIAGLDVAAAVFSLLDQEMTFTSRVDEGSKGIATLTRRFVDMIQSTQATILDTRKTAPGLRATDKIAVRRGGGQNHRQGLYDMILIKDNHIDYAGSLTQAVNKARAAGTRLEIEVECRSLENVAEAVALGVTRILLDNMTVEMMKEAVRLTAGRTRLEASGNVTLETVRSIAETGVDFISVGELTHSPRVFDLSLRVNIDTAGARHATISES
jgi:nicotinate-nucleotide pyrophosphorylase (carboxylating)